MNPITNEKSEKMLKKLRCPIALSGDDFSQQEVKQPFLGWVTFIAPEPLKAIFNGG
jgi:hypothetical protein